MAFSNNWRFAAVCIGAIAVSAVLFYFGNGLFPIWPLMWFAPLPILLLATRSNGWTAAFASLAAMMLGYLNMWNYFTRSLGMPPADWLAITCKAGLVFAAGVLLFRALLRRGAPWSALFSLPSLWVTFEYLRTVTWPHGTAASLAYTQLSFLPFLQLASITGPWGMSFLLLLLPSAIAIGLYLRRSSPRQSVQIVTAAAGLIALVLLFGTLRLAVPQTRNVKVGLVVSDAIGGASMSPRPADTLRRFQQYAQAAATLARQGAQVIVMPEGGLGTNVEGHTAATDATLQTLADQSNVTLIAGVIDWNGTHAYDQARIYTPHASLRRYDKQHLLPPFESDLTPGTARVVLSPQHPTWAVAICKDMDFASPARIYGKAGVGLMLVPAGDFGVDRVWHGHIAVMRGVEDGFTVARAAINGLLTVSDNRGRILADIRSNSSPFATALVSVPTRHSATVYQLLGDWFAWLAIALLALILFQLIRRFHAR